ncbi:glycosyltransferase family 4 protein [Thermococcus sp.]|uniref:glycosyltransferase family 4 protein n=1 Tax=Thermococcus sp. TaxID=35749 RepID=UPI00260CE273|nr:glycosyltransferase family 4 protein [Thermococcus sp.]
MESLKIALVSDWYYPKLGGVAVHIHDLALNLRRLGHEVDIITNNLPTGRENELWEAEVGLVKVPGHVVKDVGVNATVLSHNARILEPYLRDYDVVHGQHAFTPLALKAVSLARKLGQASIITTHSIDLENTQYLRAAARVTFPYFKYYLMNPHRIIAVSKASKLFIKKFTDVPVDVVYNGINTSMFHDGWNKDELREELGLGDGPLILYVGRLEPRKGVNVLVSAMRWIDGTLLVVGNGNMLPLLRSEAKMLGVSERVRFMGTVEYGLLPRIYGASDVFVLPSLSEAFGIVLLEAMSSGVPTVGTTVGGIPEIIDRCGLLVPPGDARKLAEAVNMILDNKSLAKKLGRLGRERVEEIYSWNVIVRRTVSIYKEVLGGGESSGH